MRTRILTLGAAFASLMTGTAFSEEITVSCGIGDVQIAQCKRDADAWSKETGNSVKVVEGPASSSDLLGIYQTLFAAQSSDIDVVMVDVVWPGLLSPFLIDLTPYMKDLTPQNVQTMIDTYTVDGKLVAVPQFLDIGVLYYRKDLLDKYHRPVPETWEDLIATAKLVQDGERAQNKSFWGYALHAFADEGLTCAAAEWVDSYRGAFVSPDGKIAVNSPQVKAAFSTIARFIGNIAPEGSLTANEESARGVFQSGNAAFMRNWPYAISLMEADDSPVKGKFAVTALPKGGPDGKHSGNLGGNGFGVSKFSRHQDLAARFAMYMGSKAAEKANASQFSLIPSLKELYADKDVQAANPALASLPDLDSILVPRPAQTKSKYNRVSSAIFSTVSDVLSHKIDPDHATASLDQKLKQIYKGKW
ncbi:ABC transporter substrate-binding protein [Mesorhizobium sophorae]|uniref:ABC transporter substrate-binding protein n=1 Tax=Mesorhizobium sophorae TaxID=1300294 RepID=UPI00142E8981|nr:ABC transporter substrate-binding protein [Mesorhizobium sophorae]